MSVAKQQHHRMTVAEFLDWSKDDPQRYELVHGEAFAMAPGSLIHQSLAGRLGRTLGNALASRTGCSVLPEVGIALGSADNTFYEADLAVSCEPLTRGRYFLTEPVLVIEILSPSIENHDRKNKVPDYRRIPSVREIVLVDQDRPYVEVLRRIDAGRWQSDILQGLDAVLRLDAVPLELDLADLYRDIEFETEVPKGQPVAAGGH